MGDIERVVAIRSDIEFRLSLGYVLSPDLASSPLPLSVGGKGGGTGARVRIDYYLGFDAFGENDKGQDAAQISDGGHEQVARQSTDPDVRIDADVVTQGPT